MSQRVYESVKDQQRTWSIIVESGNYHFQGKFLRCKVMCKRKGYWDTCKKLCFPYEDVAVLYSKYQFIKYDRQNTVYWSSDCRCYHLRTSRRHDATWVRR
jgi:hypothetical protein